MTRWCMTAVLALSLTTGRALAGPGLVRTVRCSASGGSARVVVDLSRAMSYSAHLSSDSTALVIEIPGAVSESSLGEVSVGESGIRSVVTRTVDAGAANPRVEVTMLLDRMVSWKDFSLPPGGGKPARIVVDIFPGAAYVAPPVVAAGDSETMATPDVTPETSAVPESRVAPGAGGRPFVVAIDPGHGGHDTGALGRYGLMEKKLNLDIAQRVARDLNQRPGVRGVLTRDNDRFLTLPQRNEVAEKLGADVFVSIHLNSAPSSSARGAEIYFVAPAGAEKAANQEMNSGEAADEFGLDGREDADIVHMLLDVNQQSVLARSEALAACILEEVRERQLLPTRNVKQKSFSVLRTISMPSVLVESGFLTNSADAKLLRTEDGRARIAHAIAEGISEFLRANPPQRGTVDETRAIVHRVQNGDTLWTLSKRYNTTITRICQLNGFRTAQPLRVGQEIVVQR